MKKLALALALGTGLVASHARAAITPTQTFTTLGTTLNSKYNTIATKVSGA